MFKHTLRLTSALLLLLPLGSQAGAVTALQDQYAAKAQQAFKAERGEMLWNQQIQDPKTGRDRSCALCHTNDLKQTGKHARTGKTIQPMAPSVNPKRLSDAHKIEKWFKRNCKWTLGRECTEQEKGDLLAFIGSR